MTKSNYYLRKENPMKNKWFVWGSIFLVIAIIGLVSVLNNTKNVNWGAVLFPGLISAVLFFQYNKRKTP